MDSPTTASQTWGTNWKPCANCGSLARVSPFSAKDDEFAYHQTPEDCIRELAQRVAALEKRADPDCAVDVTELVERIGALEAGLQRFERILRESDKVAYDAEAWWNETAAPLLRKATDQHLGKQE